MAPIEKIPAACYTIPMSVNNPHDRIFKEIESIRENAADFIAGTFPDDLKKNLDLSTLELDNTSYLSEDLQESFSDIVYTCRYCGTTEITISLLFEHKSSPAPHPHLQLLRYMLRIWENHLKNNLPLQVVVPVIFYHGTDQWIVKPLSEYFPGIEPVLMRFVPEFAYLLTDLARYEDQDIREKLFKREANRILMLLMKHVFNEQWFAEHLTDVFTPGRDFFEQADGERFLISILVYLFNTTELKSDSIIEKLSEISYKGGEIAMTTAMKLKEEGIKEGKIEDARRMLEEGLAVDLIVKCTGLPREEIEKLGKN